MPEVLETTPAAPADHPSRVALAAQEAERKRVARELHDEVGQGLVAVALMAEQAAANPPDDPSGRFAEIARRVHFYLDELRRIAHELRPRSEEHTSELQSQSHISYAVFCLKK